MLHPSNELSEAALDALIADERARVATPLTEWRTLAGQLEVEGLLRSDATVHSSYTPSASARWANDSLPQSPSRRSPVLQWGMRIAASIVFLGAGVVIGRSGTGGEPPAQNVAMQNTQQAQQASADAELVLGDFASLEEARKVRNKAQVEYLRSSAYLAAHNEGDQLVRDVSQLQERLMVFDVVVAAYQQALKESPNDPVLKQYYESSSGVRQATLQMVNRNLPSGAQVVRY